MPNWCVNRLEVRGEPERVEAFHRAFCGKPALFPPQVFETHNKSADEVQELIEKQRRAWEQAELKPCFNAQYPVPDEILRAGYSVSGRNKGKSLDTSLADLFDPTKSVDGYTWCVSHWGTKWDVYGSVQVEQGVPGFREYHFDTAWSPPFQWLEKVSRDWPDIRFELVYEEGGMGFAGRVVIEGDKVDHEEVGEDEYRQFVIDNFDYDPLEGYEDEELA